MSTQRMDLVPREPRFALRRHRKVVVVLAVSIALALSGLGIESASASTRSRLAVSLNSDRSSAARLDGSKVNGKIYVFVRNSKTLDKVDFYIDSPRWTDKPPVRTDKKAPFDLAGTRTDGTARPYNTTKLADGTHTIRVVMTWASGRTSTWRGRFKVHNGGVKPTPTPTTTAPATTAPATTAPATTAPATTAPPTTAPATTAPATTAPTATTPKTCTNGDTIKEGVAASYSEAGGGEYLILTTLDVMLAATRSSPPAITTTGISSLTPEPFDMSVQTYRTSTAITTMCHDQDHVGPLRATGPRCSGCL
jgi:hypothetical protein